MRKGDTYYGKWLQQSPSWISSHQHVGILRIRDPVLYPYRRLHSVACVFFRWHEKCEPAQLCKILFLPSDPSCNFRNRGCHHWRCSSQRCCILLRFPLLIGKIRVNSKFNFRFAKVTSVWIIFARLTSGSAPLKQK